MTVIPLRPMFLDYWLLCWCLPVDAEARDIMGPVQYPWVDSRMSKAVNAWWGEFQLIGSSVEFLLLSQLDRLFWYVVTLLSEDCPIESSSGLCLMPSDGRTPRWRPPCRLSVSPSLPASLPFSLTLDSLVNKSTWTFASGSAFCGTQIKTFIISSIYSL